MPYISDELKFRLNKTISKDSNEYFLGQINRTIEGKLVENDWRKGKSNGEWENYFLDDINIRMSIRTKVNNGYLITHLGVNENQGSIKKIFSNKGKSIELLQNLISQVKKIIGNSIKTYESERLSNNLKSLRDVKSSIENIEINSDLRGLLKENQNSFEDEQILKILKVIDYYEKSVRNYQGLYQNLTEKNFNERNQGEITKTLNMIPYMYKSLLILEGLIEIMLRAYISNDKVDYYTIYNVFEEEGLFMSRGERLMISNMKSIINELEKVNNSVNSLIISTIKMGQVLSAQLSKIESKLDLNNLLTSINTYKSFN